MGIIYLQPQKYKCSKCGGEGKPYSRSARPERPGTYKGVKCVECGHKTNLSTYHSRTGNGKWCILES